MTQPDALTDQLADFVSSGAIAADGRLPSERELAERFNVTRTRLRGALDVLEDRGVIYRRQGRGTFAAPPVMSGQPALTRLARETTPQDMMEVRLQIEPALAAHAARRARREDVQRLEGFMQATLDHTERAAYEMADDTFHYQIAVLARNPLFLQIYDEIRTVRKLNAWESVREESHTPGVMTRFGDQHRALFDAIASRDSTEAARRMELHLLDVNQTLLRRPRV
ncbi:FCD domain-containing protein [Marivita sp. GX14005]|uniref:FadR/GntR family transcriptional regulator n=1 Tax=Marivita sp. GX14005 TaxID=2942276 RepID=UPI002018A4D0|nr:FCD domain-containing protein [Marivita sp. GX14005]MCL3883247.1 FCD domain-containing protein [Marivita sp. GX14005]